MWIYIPMVLTLVGIDMLLNNEQSWKAVVPSDSICIIRLLLIILMIKIPIIVTLDGIDMLVNDEQPTNVLVAN